MGLLCRRRHELSFAVVVAIIARGQHQVLVVIAVFRREQEGVSWKKEIKETVIVKMASSANVDRMSYVKIEPPFSNILQIACGFSPSKIDEPR